MGQEEIMRSPGASLMINSRNAYLVLLIVLFATLGCDRDAITTTQAESFQTNVVVMPSVIEYNEPFDIIIEVMNWTEEPFTIRYCGFPYDYCIIDETGYCWGGVGIGCIPGSELDEFEFHRFSIVKFEYPPPLILPPGTYVVRAGITGVPWTGNEGKYCDETVLIVEQ